MQLSDLRSRVRIDPELNSTTVITDSNLNLLLNEGALDLARKGHAFILSATWQAVASTQRYILSGGASPKVTRFLDIFEDAGGLIYTDADGVVRTHPTDFRMTSESWLDIHRNGWQNDDPDDNLQNAFLSFDSSGNLCVGVHPASETTVPSFKLFYLGGGTTMSADADYPWGINAPHLEFAHKYICEYALWQIHELLTKDDIQAQAHLQKYLAGALELKTQQDRVFFAEIAGSMDAEGLNSAQTFGSF